jgi:hypothetical protein
MTLVYERDGHSYFLEQSRVQLERAFGSHERRGTVEDPAVALHAIADQYKIFYGTYLLLLAGVLVLGYRCFDAFRTRSLEQIRSRGIVFAWALAAVLSFTLIKLKHPHYLIMVLVPLCLLVVSELLRTKRMRMVVFVGAALVALNLGTFAQRFVLRDDNALADVRAYMRAEVDPGALVLTEESIGSLIEQPYCKLVYAARCRDADFVVTYTSYTQRLPESAALDELMRTARLVASFDGFKETIHVYRTS